MSMSGTTQGTLVAFDELGDFFGGFGTSQELSMYSRQMTKSDKSFRFYTPHSLIFTPG